MAGPLALVATASAVSLGVLMAEPPSTDRVTARTTAADLQSMTDGSASAGATREGPLSRSAGREIEPVETKLDRVLSGKATRQAVKDADTKRWTTAPLNLWSEPGDKAQKKGVLEPGEKVLVTGRVLYGRQEIVLDGKTKWVTKGYLAAEKPVEESAEDGAAAIGGACTNGTTVQGGVTASIVRVHEAVCAAFPSISSYGYLRGGGGDHGTGHAVDIMVSGSAGQAVADFVRAHASELGVSYVIFAQRIWSVERGGEGWRAMPNRGSATANHYDHVHVSVY